MRIAIDGQPLLGNLTGAGKALKFLLRELRASFPEYEFIVISPRDRSRWRLPQQLIWDQFRIPAAALVKKASLLHMTGHSGSIFWQRPLVMTVHDLAAIRFPDLLPTRRSRWYWGRCIASTAKRANVVIVPSYSTKQDLIEVCHIPNEKIKVIPWGVPLRYFEEEETGEVIKRRYGLEKPYLLYVGTLDRRKDYSSLLNALLQIDRDVDLVLE